MLQKFTQIFNLEQPDPNLTETINSIRLSVKSREKQEE